MRLLRWKSRYASGDLEADRHNKKFVACLNKLMDAAGRREHCREMDEFIDSLGAEVEHQLSHGHEAARTMIRGFHDRLVGALPLRTYSTSACRKCGLCEVAQAQIAEHLHAPLSCLKE